MNIPIDRHLNFIVDSNSWQSGVPYSIEDYTIGKYSILKTYGDKPVVYIHEYTHGFLDNCVLLLDWWIYYEKEMNDFDKDLMRFFIESDILRVYQQEYPDDFTEPEYREEYGEED